MAGCRFIPTPVGQTSVWLHTLPPPTRFIPTPVGQTIGERVRERRHELGWTLKHLADVTELSLPYLSDVERGRTQPSVKTLTRVAAGLGLNVTDLMTGVEEYGEASDAALPAGLKELKEDPEWGQRINEHWLQTLQRVNYRGKRPVSKQDWLYVFMSLESVFNERQQ